jgi:hypothetical protein
VAREFPPIANFGSAFRFALEAELAAAELAAAAESQAPDEAWRTRFEELVCTHQDREAKLTVIRQEVNEMILEPLAGIDGAAFTSVLAAEPAQGWPAAAEQVIAAEEEAAAFHEEFVAKAEDVLAASARAFKRAAKQEREVAAQLRQMLHG